MSLSDRFQNVSEPERKGEKGESVDWQERCLAAERELNEKHEEWLKKYAALAMAKAVRREEEVGRMREERRREREKRRTKRRERETGRREDASSDSPSLD
jgi:hypothetical protein